MDNQTLEELAAFSELLDLNKMFMLVAAAIFLWLASDLLRRLSQKLMEKIVQRLNVLSYLSRCKCYVKCACLKPKLIWVDLESLLIYFVRLQLWHAR